jgi:2-amino-4-hydroxy-6-hydroxymethyldihydropteridine diphosphokinase/dihydropteroate synthase
MQIYLGLGSNLGDRRDNLRRGLESLARSGVDVVRVSPVVESPALLPTDARPEWNLPFLNIAAECRTDTTPESLRNEIKRIERELGRDDADRWSPRPIDIDILVWGDQQVRTPTLTIPHRDSHTRSFVLTPLIALQPRLRLPGKPGKSVLQWSEANDEHIPLWMGIVNITPDSFSDGGQFADWASLEPEIAAMLAAGVHIVDVGAESTRPGATPIDASQEWQRLEPLLVPLLERLAGDPLRPRVSLDTYHPETARRAIGLGVDIINDVTGLRDPDMLDLAADNDVDWIAMHSLSVPVVKDETLPLDRDPQVTIETWLEQRLDDWDRAGIDLNRIIVDPGIGFGKDSLQSLDLLRSASRLRRYDVRVLVGHSRKSFLTNLTGADVAAKDFATAGMSLALCAQHIDILRVHNVPLHAAAYRGWSEARASSRQRRAQLQTA